MTTHLIFIRCISLLFLVSVLHSFCGSANAVELGSRKIYPNRVSISATSVDSARVRLNKMSQTEYLIFLDKAIDLKNPDNDLLYQSLKSEHLRNLTEREFEYRMKLKKVEIMIYKEEKNKDEQANNSSGCISGFLKALFDLITGLGGTTI